MKNTLIVIYDKKDGLPAFVVDTIEEACKWIGVSAQALYKALHLTGLMQAKGYYIEKTTLKGEEK